MQITQELLDSLTNQAKNSPRLRMNYDIRNNSDDGSQRMLNALEPGTQMPMHRHRETSETVACIRGHLKEYFFDEEGKTVKEVVDMNACGPCLGVNVPMDMWHTVEVLESGTVILEVKDGHYEPLGKDDILVPLYNQ